MPEVKKISKKNYVKVLKDNEEKDVEIDEAANEIAVRKIKGLMKKDQIIDIFKEAEVAVGKTMKRMYPNMPHA